MDGEIDIVAEGVRRGVGERSAQGWIPPVQAIGAGLSRPCVRTRPCGAEKSRTAHDWEPRRPRAPVEAVSHEQLPCADGPLTLTWREALPWPHDQPIALEPPVPR